MRSPLIPNLEAHNAVLLTTGPVLDSSSLGLIHPAELKLCALWQIPPSCLLPLPLATTIQLSASLSLPILDSSYKWYHTVFVLLCLAYFTVLHIHPCCHKWQDFLLVKEFLYNHSISERYQDSEWGWGVLFTSFMYDREWDRRKQVCSQGDRCKHSGGPPEGPWEPWGRPLGGGKKTSLSWMLPERGPHFPPLSSCLLTSPPSSVFLCDFQSPWSSLLTPIYRRALRAGVNANKEWESLRELWGKVGWGFLEGKWGLAGLAHEAFHFSAAVPTTVTPPPYTHPELRQTKSSSNLKLWWAPPGWMCVGSRHRSWRNLWDSVRCPVGKWRKGCLLALCVHSSRQKVQVGSLGSVHTLRDQEEPERGHLLSQRCWSVINTHINALCFEGGPALPFQWGESLLALHTSLD